MVQEPLRLTVITALKQSSDLGTTLDSPFTRLVSAENEGVMVRVRVQPVKSSDGNLNRRILTFQTLTPAQIPALFENPPGTTASRSAPGY
jgi:hypothetical protein